LVLGFTVNFLLGHLRYYQITVAYQGIYTPGALSSSIYQLNSYAFDSVSIGIICPRTNQHGSFSAVMQIIPRIYVDSWNASFIFFTK
jgi:hypothetical protein